MLKKEQISDIRMLSEEWKIARLANFTSSEIFNLTGETPDTKGAMNYIRRKVGEELTGRPALKDIDTDSTRWGNLYEIDAIRKFGQSLGITFLITQQLIKVPGTRFSSTPDGLIIESLTPDGEGYNVITVEVKCPETFDAYIELFECETPLDVKKAEKKYYYQVLDQMDNCGALGGYLVIYHPEFSVGNFKAIKFNSNFSMEVKGKPTFPVFQDLKMLRERKLWAENKFYDIRDKLIKAGKV